MRSGGCDLSGQDVGYRTRGVTFVLQELLESAGMGWRHFLSWGWEPGVESDLGIGVRGWAGGEFSVLGELMSSHTGMAAL